MSKAKRFNCKICGLEISNFTLGTHCKAKHDMNAHRYKEMFNELEKKEPRTCVCCGKDTSHMGKGTKYCSSECNIKYKMDEWNKKFDGIPDIPTCVLCGKKSLDLKQHIMYTHKIKMADYIKKYGLTKYDVYHNSTLKKFSDGVKGEKNPAYQHGGRLSPYSKSFIHYKGEDYRKSVLKKAQENRSYTTDREYWLEEAQANYNLADWLLSQRQSTFSKEKCIEKHGKEKGLEVWKDRQEKWLSNYKKQNYSNVSQELFWMLYDNIKNDFKEIYFAQLDGNYNKDISGRNYEYRLDIGNTFCRPDFLVKDVNRIIEFDGDYWHGKVGNIQRERMRDEGIINEGYEVLHIKENDWKIDKVKIIEMCKDFIYGTTK